LELNPKPMTAHCLRIPSTSLQYKYLNERK
jgi:hypothetical protein